MKRILSSLRFQWAVLCLGFLCCTCRAEAGQSTTHPLISVDNYGRVLDAVFGELQQTATSQYSMTLRFMTSRHAESEILVQVSNDGKVEAALFTITQKSVWTAANEYLQRTGRFDPDEIARSVQVRRQPISMSTTQVSSWHTNAMKSLGQAELELEKDLIRLQKTGEATIFLDGSTYELRVMQGTTDLRWSTMDAEVDDHTITGRSSLARWMNGARQYAFAHAAR